MIGAHEKGGHVGPQGKEGRRAKIHIAGVPAQDVPGRGQHNVLQDDVRGKVKVPVLHGSREQQSQANDAERQHYRYTPLHALPPEESRGPHGQG